MTISYPLTLPVSPRSVKWSTVNNVVVQMSPYSFEQQKQLYDGKSWAVQISFPSLRDDDARKMLAFLISLKGQQGSFLFGDPSLKTPRGNATGTPLVHGASQTGESLVTRGWTASTTNILKAGDFIQIGNRLYAVLTDTNSNGSGQATLDIFPTIRESPADGTAIITSSAKGLFQLTTNITEWQADEAHLFDFSISAVEAV